MENYTKYALKAAEELTSLLCDQDHICVIACNKCFHEYNSTDNQDCDNFLALAENLGKTITGVIRPDFLCKKKMQNRVKVCRIMIS